MKAVKQMNVHRPADGIYGDCHRACVASILELPIETVPHFFDGCGDDASEAQCHAACDAEEAWLGERGLRTIRVVYDGSTDLKGMLATIANTNHLHPGLFYILGGSSKNGTGHSVVCCDGAIVHDPSMDESGIVGPMRDGCWWVTFFGAAL